jgi:hypothetical protein
MACYRDSFIFLLSCIYVDNVSQADCRLLPSRGVLCCVSASRDIICDVTTYGTIITVVHAVHFQLQMHSLQICKEIS